MKKLNWTMAIAGMIGVLMMCVAECHAAKLYAIVKMQGGVPDLGELQYRGYVLCDQKGGYGAYLITGTKEQLDAIVASKNVTPVGSVKEYVPVLDADGKATTVKELSNPTLTKEHAEKLNALSLGTAKPTIKEGAKIDDAVTELYKSFNSKFDIRNMWVVDPDEEDIKLPEKEKEVIK